MAMGEREALQLLHAATVAGVRSDLPDLTARQTAILLTVVLYAGPHTVRGLAESLNLSKPVVSRALDKLAAQDLILRQVDESDLRSVLIVRTPAAAAYVRQLAVPLTTEVAWPARAAEHAA